MMQDVRAIELIEKLAKELREQRIIIEPSWTHFVKTGTHKERPPARDDWYYVRAASILRKVALHSPIGVSKLRTLYGGKKNRGYKPEHFFKGSGSIIRDILQQFDKNGMTKYSDKGVHKGRVITGKGKKLLDKCGFKEHVKRAKIVAEEIKEKKPKAKQQNVTI